ncbi:GDSL-type esterase/lipase family protein [Streptomyces sp. NPDC088251]|uniref:GDSL-type esterase/lipase family protein n=1 Tax=Streptomyces sp. NPDC088251 TaxID=3365844 RepID=UPI00380E52EC
MHIKDEDTLLFIGDSIADAGRDRTHSASFGSGYVQEIAQTLRARASAGPGPGPTVINKGLDGNRVYDLESRWTTDVIDHRPTVVTVKIGINDTWRRYDRGLVSPVGEFEACLGRLLAETVRTTGRHHPFSAPGRLRPGSLVRGLVAPYRRRPSRRAGQRSPGGSCGPRPAPCRRGARGSGAGPGRGPSESPRPQADRRRLACRGRPCPPRTCDGSAVREAAGPPGGRPREARTGRRTRLNSQEEPGRAEQACPPLTSRAAGSGAPGHFRHQARDSAAARPRGPGPPPGFDGRSARTL